jgi:transposase
MAYDEKYRKRAVEYCKEGHTIEETAKVFKIGTATLRRHYKTTFVIS